MSIPVLARTEDSMGRKRWLQSRFVNAVIQYSIGDCRARFKLIESIDNEATAAPILGNSVFHSWRYLARVLRARAMSSVVNLRM
jgi:hypothetical protein